MADLTPLPRRAERTLPEFVRAPVQQGEVAAIEPSGGVDARPEPARASRLRSAQLPGAAAATAAVPVEPARAPASVGHAAPSPRTAPAHAPREQCAQAATAASDAATLARRARRALEAQRYDEAFQLVVRAQRLAPQDATCRALRGFLLYLRGEHGADAERLIDEALQRDPLCERAHHYKGMLALARHDLELAAFHFRQAVVIDPDNQQAAHQYRHCREQQRGVRGVLNAVLCTAERCRAPFVRRKPRP